MKEAEIEDSRKIVENSKKIQLPKASPANQPTTKLETTPKKV